MNKVRNKNLGARSVILIAVLFAVPIMLAMWLRFGATGWQPDTTNHGELIEPPIALEAVRDDARYAGYWLVLRIAPAVCNEDCADLKATLARLRVALGEDQHRVKFVAVKPDSPLRNALERYREDLPAGEVLLVDPRGFLMMRYVAGFDVNGLLEDLQRLLRYARVGVQ